MGFQGNQAGTVRIRALLLFQLCCHSCCLIWPHGKSFPKRCCQQEIPLPGAKFPKNHNSIFPVGKHLWEYSQASAGASLQLLCCLQHLPAPLHCQGSAGTLEKASFPFSLPPASGAPRNTRLHPLPLLRCWFQSPPPRTFSKTWRPQQWLC